MAPFTMFARYHGTQGLAKASIHDGVQEGVVDHRRFSHKFRNFCFTGRKQMVALENTDKADQTVWRPT